MAVESAMDALEHPYDFEITTRECLREMDKASIPAAMHATEAAFLRSGFVRLSPSKTYRGTKAYAYALTLGPCHTGNSARALSLV